jgi:hypothetical protein
MLHPRSMSSRNLLWIIPALAGVAAVAVLLRASEGEEIEEAPLLMKRTEAPPQFEAVEEAESDLDATPSLSRGSKKRNGRLSQKEEASPDATILAPVEKKRPKGLSDQAFYAALDSWRGPEACARETGGTASVQTDARAALRMRFTIDPDGEVKQTKTTQAEGPSADRLRPCIERRAKELRFPAFAGREAVERDATFIF